MSAAYFSGIGECLSQKPPEGRRPEEAGATVEAFEGTTTGAEVDVMATRGDQGTGEAPEPSAELHSAQIIFDRYQVVAKDTKAVDEVRRADSKSRPELTRSRYAWLK
jgi:hypothetical protein